MEELMTVMWSPYYQEWHVCARSSVSDGWSVFEGAEDELDTLLSLARDVVTGG